MADETKPAIGMSVGATTLAAVTAERAVTRRPVLTLYPDRSPRVGAPAEHCDTGPDSGDVGLMIVDFVDRVGAAVPVMASDGSAHRGEQLLADSLYALAYSATEGRPLPPAVAVSYPAHWSAASVDALRAGLSRVPEWSQHPALLLSDVAAALTALYTNPGLPAAGIIAVCDFGGSGSSITLVDAANDYQPLGATVRYTGFSGDLVDQALLDHVVAELTAEGSANGTSGIGSPARLRGQCRRAKEQLSTNTVTELPVDLPGFHGGIWVTRAELDEAIRQPFEGFLAAVHKLLGRNNIQPSNLTAVVAVGGGANIPMLASGLSERLGVTVISSPRPQLTAAIGAALKVADNPARAGQAPPVMPTAADLPPVAELASAPVPTASADPVAPPPEPSVSLPEPAPAPAAAPPEPPEPARPAPHPDREPIAQQAENPPRQRRAMLVIVMVALAALLVGAVAVIALRRAADSEPAPPTMTSVSVTPSREPIIRHSPAAPEPPVAPETPETPETSETSTEP